MTDWRDISSGPGAVAERDQFEADVRDLVREARMLFVASAHGDNPAVLDIKVRGLCNLPVSEDAEYRDAYAQFLLLAMDELARMVNDLEDAA